MTVVAAIQMPVTGEKEVNLDKACALLGEAAAKGARLACLPEYFLADCPEQHMTAEQIGAVAETLDGPSLARLRETGKETGMYVCAGSFIEKGADGLLRNTSALIGPDGAVVGTYSKTHPENAPPKYEVGCGIVPGDEYPVFDTEIGRIGIIVDMDADTAEAPRLLYAHGAELVLWPVNWSARWQLTVDAYSTAHCMINAYFMVVANRVGTRLSQYGTFHYNGGSRVVDPEGCAIARITDYFEGVVAADVDFGLLRLWRDEIIPRDYPYKRRPETYGDLIRPL
jgi:N-carbamoylputrescine amidase